MARRVVVFPAPLVPSRLTMLPSGTWRLTPLQNLNDVVVNDFDVVDFQQWTVRDGRFPWPRFADPLGSGFERGADPAPPWFSGNGVDCLPFPSGIGKSHLARINGSASALFQEFGLERLAHGPEGPVLDHVELQGVDSHAVGG
jgi:hypothetical protein